MAITPDRINKRGIYPQFGIFPDDFISPYFGVRILQMLHGIRRLFINPLQPEMIK